MSDAEEKIALDATACIFPGQGSQYIEMGKDFFSAYPIARQTFEEADDLLQTSFSKIIFSSSQSELTQTKNSQPAIFLTSMAIFRVLQELFPEWQAKACAGLSLGEYTALTASGKISFEENINLVAKRGLYMHEACEETKGAMAVVLAMTEEAVNEVLLAPKFTNCVWAANFNCPGQIVISGTVDGVAIASKTLLEQGAKRVVPLDVHGAFHSQLMLSAQEKLSKEIEQVHFKDTTTQVAMNVTGHFAKDSDTIKKLLLQQVTHPVRWQTCVETMDQTGISLFIEIGCGKTLTAMNKRIKPRAQSINIESVQDIAKFEKIYATQ